jgi:ubiquinone/menaquinone biosynthesis C-methylase UbiE
MNEREEKERIRNFWNSRAELGLSAGSQDVTLKKLEIEAISRFVKDGMRIIDIGCGNGITAIHLAEQYSVEVLGLDFAEEMVIASRDRAAGRSLKGTVRFEKGDVQDLSGISDRFDLAYTERTIINLPDWDAQKKAIVGITNLLVEEGSYVMCEHSHEGLCKINSLRKRLGLSEIAPPWHNRYIREHEVEQVDFPGVSLDSIVDFSSTYYFLSRLVNAWIASQEGKEPEYEAPINQLALELPSFGDIGQGKIWLWRKAA